MTDVNYDGAFTMPLVYQGEVLVRKGEAETFNYRVSNNGQKEYDIALNYGNIAECLSANTNTSFVEYTTRVKLDDDVMTIYIGQSETIAFRFTEVFNRSRRAPNIDLSSPGINDKKNNVSSTQGDIDNLKSLGRVIVNPPNILNIAFEYTLYENRSGLVIGSQCTVHYFIRNKAIVVGVPIPNIQQLGSLVNTCPKITILMSTDPIWGQNLSSVFFKSEDKKYVHRPKLTSVLDGIGCTLMEKLASPELRNVDSNSIITYGLLRYFLWFLIACKWDITILLQSNTKRFFNKLRKSNYACWVNAFNNPQLKGYDKYYLQ